MNRGRLARLAWTVTVQRMGIRRVKGAKRLGVGIGNWLTVEQSRVLLGEPPSDHLRGKRDHALLALLIGCGLRRAELVGLGTKDFQVREEHWVLADLIGTGAKPCCTLAALYTTNGVLQCK